MEMLQFACWFSPVLKGQKAIKNAIAVLHHLGGTFFSYDQNLNRYPVLNPTSESCVIEPESGLFEIQHSLFGSEIINGGLIPQSGYLMLMVDANYIDNRDNEEHAQALLKLAFNLYSILQPVFCWVDGAGYDTPNEKEIATFNLRKLMWANFYGPEYVDKYGREFLLNAPGWKKEELNDGGIAYIISPSYLRKTELVSAGKISQYFRPKAKVKVYIVVPND